MEENWLFSTPTVFNTETASLNGQNKVAKEMGVIIEEMTNMVKPFGVDLHLQKNETKERTDQLEIAFATAFDEPEHYKQEEISKCKCKDDIIVTKLRNEIKQLKSENGKLKREAYEKDSIRKALTDTTAITDETRWQTQHLKSIY